MGDVVAGLRHLAGGDGEEPAAIADALEVQAEDLGVGIERARQRVAGPGGWRAARARRNPAASESPPTVRGAMVSMGAAAGSRPRYASHIKFATNPGLRKNPEALEENSTPGAIGPPLSLRRCQQPFPQRPNGVAGLAVGVPAEIVRAG